MKLQMAVEELKIKAETIENLRYIHISIFIRCRWLYHWLLCNTYIYMFVYAFIFYVVNGYRGDGTKKDEIIGELREMANSSNLKISNEIQVRT